LQAVLVWIVLLLSPQVFGATYTFTATTGNKGWETAANWNPPGIPGGSDTAIIPPTSSGYTVTINSQTLCAELILGGPTDGQWNPALAQVLDLQSGSLTVGGNCTVHASGMLNIGAQVTGLSQTESHIVVEGAVVFKNSGTHIVDTIDIVVADGGYLTITEEPNGVILTNGASIEVEAGGNLTLASMYGINNDGNTPVSLVNHGDLYCAPAAGDDFSTIVAVPFYNFGNFHVLTGTVTLKAINSTWDGTLDVTTTSSIVFTGGQHFFSADSSVQGNGTLQVLNGADMLFQGAIQINYVELSLGSFVVDNPGVMTQFANFVMSGGSLSGSETSITELSWAGGLISMNDLTVTNLQFIGAFTASMSSTHVSVLQQASFQDTTHLLLFNSTFDLEAGAQMAFNKDVYLICEKNDTGSTLNIAGALQITNTNPIAVICNLNVPSTGVITTIGLLDIQTTLTLSGTLNITAKSTVTLETTSTFNPGSSVVGTGTLNCQSCTAQISGHFDIGTFNFPAGTVTFQVDSQGQEGGYVANVLFFNQSGSSSLILSNNSPACLNFSVVNMHFSGGNVTSNYNERVNLQANLIVTNSSSFFDTLPYLFTNVAFVNFGTTTFYGNGNLKLWQTNTFYNAPSGTIQVVGGKLVVSQNDMVGYVSELRNEGHFIVSVGATAQLAVTLRNRGSFEVGGQISIVSGFLYQEDANSVTHIPASGSMFLTNPSVFFGGVLKGSGFISGTVTLNNGILEVNDNSSLAISNFILRANGTLEVDVTSTGMLKVESLCQITGGNLVLYSDYPEASGRQYASAPSILGSGFDNVLSASLNDSFGFFIENELSALNVKVVPLPTITSMSATSGPAGTVLTVSGANFYIDNTAINVTIHFQDQVLPTYANTIYDLVATVPVGTGTASVFVVADGRASNTQQWSYPPPTLESISPQSGPTTGGTQVTIKGSNFGVDASVVAVSFGSLACPISNLTDNQIVCIAPPGIGANVSVTVQASKQQNSILYSYFGPTLTSVYPSVIVVSAQGGNPGMITVTGQNLAPTGATNVNVTILIGDYTCGNTTQTSLSTYTCTPSSSLIASGSNANYSLKVVVADQPSNSLTFQVFHNNPPQKATNHWWPFPWWIFLVMAGALVIFLVVGIMVGCKIAKRERYEPLPQSNKRMSATLN
jgi:hypothetical protein